MLCLKNTNTQNMDILLDNFSDFKEDIYKMWERGINFHEFEIDKLFKYLRMLKKKNRNYITINFDKYPYKTQPQNGSIIRHCGGYIRCIVSICKQCQENNNSRMQYFSFKQRLFYYCTIDRWRKV
jgi:phage-related protein